MGRVSNQTNKEDTIPVILRRLRLSKTYGMGVAVVLPLGQEHFEQPSYLLNVK